MKKMRKYGLIIVLSILIIIAIMICAVKFINVKKDAPEIKEVSVMEEEQPTLIDIDETSEEENVPRIDGEEQQEEKQKENKNEETNNDIPYYIKVNNQANVVTIYTKDGDGNYTIPYKSMICSIGTATPAAGNIYTIPGGKWDRWTWGQMVGGVWAQYYTRIERSILFHSVPYTSKDKGSLEYWEYDKLGTKASAGCIRLTVQDAKWIYENCKPGTKVEFYADSNPGPLGKPSAQKISEDEAVRGWDPTDPDANNPWINYVRPSTTEAIIPNVPAETPKVEESPATTTNTTEPATTVPPSDSENPDTQPENPTDSKNSGESGETEPTEPTESEENDKTIEPIESTTPVEMETSETKI